jgi:pimeloyl-ACP methyl ester carboxylesterase
MGKNSLHIAEQGYFWVGVTYEKRDGQAVVDGSQLYVEFQKPEEQTQPYPVVLIHGGGGQSLDWMGTPDGRPGWRTLLLQRGYAVYLVDRPGHGRSPRHPGQYKDDPAGPPALLPSVETLGRMFTSLDNPAHSQWPGTGRRDDPALGQWLASQSLLAVDPATDHAVMRQRGAELLDLIGPAIVITSSAGGPAGWLMADARPDLVRAVVALEPVGPSGPIPLAWGLAAGPLTYDPPAIGPGDLKLTRVHPSDSGSPMLLQSEPPRRLPHLEDTPIAVVSAENSFANAMDLGTVAFLRQAGCRAVEHVRLGALGVHGNGHLMMIERNNEEVLDVVTGWLDRHCRGDDGFAR